MKKGIVEQFEKISEQYPDSIALIFEDRSITFNELNIRANELANYLLSKGIKPESPVPFCIENSEYTIIALLGILKSGAAFVPISRDNPVERIVSLATSVNPDFFIHHSQDDYEGKFTNSIERIAIDKLSGYSELNPATSIQEGHLAYIVFTSGSTGFPKGVQIEHKCLSDYFDGLNKKLDLSNIKSYALVSTIAADLGYTTVFSSLINGATLHILTNELLNNIQDLHQYFNTHKIDCVKIVPSHWKALSMEDNLLVPNKLIIFGGDRLPSVYVEEISRSGSDCVIVNHYGPTETTIGKCLHIVDPASNYGTYIPIGKPIGNTKLLVLSPDLELCPLGVSGQLHICGDGLARGYLNNETLTAEKFIPNPFIDFADGRMYATGDLVKYLPDKNLEFIGRVDNQVKIRGYRIEPGEIESVLNTIPVVDQSFVVARDDHQKNKKIVAYLKTNKDFNKEDFQEAVHSKMPDYMIPAQWIFVDKFQLTENGKVDVKALPDPEIELKRTQTIELPKDELEKQLAELWKEILELDEVGVHNNFFELGGHSLLAIRLVAAIRKTFNVEMPIGDIFDFPTISLQKERIEDSKGNEILSFIQKNKRPVKIPLSFSQERLWFIDKLEGSVQYHVPSVLKLVGPLSIEALETAIASVIERHEVLRTIIVEEDEGVYQKILDKVNFKLDKIPGGMFGLEDDELISHIDSYISNPFDLNKDLNIRAEIIPVEEQVHILILVNHHIVSDGWSRSIIVKELVEFYSAFLENREIQLPELKVQYADFAIWQRGYIQGEVLERKLKYWRSKLQGATPLLLPLDFKRPQVWTSKGAIENGLVPNELLEKLQVFSQKNGVTLFMTFLAAFKSILYRYSQQSDISIGIPIAGRLQNDLEDLIGFFVNTLVLRTEVRETMRLIDLVMSVKRTSMEAFENQEVPFERVVEELVSTRDISRNPLFQVMFTMLNTPEIPEIHVNQLNITSFRPKKETSKFDLQGFAVKSRDGFNLSFEYNTDLFKPETVRQMLSQFILVLENMVSNSSQKIVDLDLTTSEERNLLKQFECGPVLKIPFTSVVELFEKNAADFPETTAFYFENTKISYGELNKRSNKIARYLVKQGVRTGSIVAVCVPRSIEMAVAVLSVLKAGAAYLPLDPEYPEERIRYMLKETEADYALGVQKTFELISGKVSHYIDLQTPDDELEKQSVKNLNLGIKGEDLAYLIFTSGSTGNPKGVMVEHRNTANLINWCMSEFSGDSFDLLYSATSLNFDISVFEIFYPLSLGKSIRILENGLQVQHYISKDKNILLNTVPSLVENLLKEKVNLDHISVLNMAGEPINNFILQNLDFKDKVVRNLYGPTETTTYSTCTKIEKDDFVTIGKPIANTTILILNKQGKVASLGVPGEICIGGKGVTRGYLKNPELTSERFIANPVTGDLSDRFYRTGDLGRWLKDGTIDFMGRMDDQVKVRGYRIELGEVENQLNHLDSIDSSCAVVKKAADGLAVLESYVIPNPKYLVSLEKELYLEQVKNWTEIYESEYSNTDQSKDLNTEFNYVSWKDSFTGEPVPEEQMKAWINDVRDRLLEISPRRVLEIGCGTGMVFFAIEKNLQQYYGTDISGKSIGQLKEHLKHNRKEPNAFFRVAAAHELNTTDYENIDTIILNSVIQYFPGEKYLDDVLKNCFEIIGNNKGQIVLGDVRDRELLNLFKARLELDKLHHSTSLRDFQWETDQSVLKEEELCLSYEYFYSLKSKYSQIDHIDIQWSRSEYINEMSLYRYSVVLFVNHEDADIYTPGWIDWNESGTIQSCIETLNSGANELAVRSIRNPRLWKEHQLLNELSQSSGTVRDLKNAIEYPSEEYQSVAELFELAHKTGYSYKIYKTGSPFQANVLFERSSVKRIVKGNPEKNIKSGNKRFSNFPLMGEIGFRLQVEVLENLKRKLPAYMIPSYLRVLEKFPLTPNGKVDRKFLSRQEDKISSNRLNFKLPESDTEKALSEIWKQLLKNDSIGVYDNFFQSGGHSLLAIRVISAIRSRLKTELEIKDLFLNPTISLLASYIDQNTSRSELLPQILKIKDRPEFIPMSFSQERLWFIDKIEGSLPYHIPSVLSIHGNLDINSLESSFKLLLKRHEALRTVFIEVDGKGYQKIQTENNWKLIITEGNKEFDVEARVKSSVNLPFNLAEDFMLRAELIRKSPKDFVLIMTIHHIASDGWSVSILVNELVNFYNSFSEGVKPKLKPLEIQYSDYAIWQRKYLKDAVLEKKLKYWEEKLKDVEPLELPTDHTRPGILSERGSSVSFEIDSKTSSGLKRVSDTFQATMFMSLLAAFKLLLNKYTGQDDICIGTPTAGRQQVAVEGLIGYFINTLALRTKINTDDSFIELLESVKQTTLDAYSNQEVPFEKVIDVTVRHRDLGRSPLFQVMFVYQNTPEVPDIELKGLKTKIVPSGQEVTKFELTLTMVETRKGIKGSVQYSTDLFNELTIIRLCSRFEELLKQIAENPQRKLTQLSFIDSAENKLLKSFNQTSRSYPVGKSILDLLRPHSSLNSTALIDGAKTIDYPELHKRSDQLAHYLLKSGVQKEEMIPVCMERSIDLVVSILAILKTGAAYVPIEPVYPTDRIQFILKDTGARFILCSETFDHEISNKVKRITPGIALKEYTKQEYGRSPVIEIQPSNLAYVIYTSGSTGMPKAVMIEHRNTVSFIHWCQSEFKDSDFELVYSVTSFCFDLSVFEILYPLSIGKPIRILESGLFVNEYLSADRKILLNCVPSLIETLVREKTDLSSVSVLNMAGEPISDVVLAGIDPDLMEVRNLYGPTEDTTYSTVHRIRKNIPVNIGRPIHNTRVYVLDKDHNPLPIGIPGEIALAGSGVARGYLNQMELTRTKFIVNTFIENSEKPIYLTGDIGKWNEDGSLEYSGRLDDQVKISGYRVEPGEIETVITQSGLLKQVVVKAAKDSNGKQYLAAFYISSTDRKEEVQAYLLNRLPSYMVPSVWVRLDAFPLTPNGKIDKKGLKVSFDSKTGKKDSVKPQNEVQQKLTEIWQDLLGVQSIGIHSNFFELGGDSILSIQLVSRCRKLGYSLRPKDIFTHQTIEKLSQLIDQNKSLEYLGEQGYLEGEVGLLPIQQWYLKFNPEKVSHFNQSVILKLNKKVSLGHLRSAFQKIAERHDALRMRFEFNDNSWSQYYGNGEIAVYEEDLTGSTDLKKQIRDVSNSYQQSLSITDGIVAKVVFFRTPAKDRHNRLVIIVHHLVVDGVSWRILLEDLEQILDHEINNISFKPSLKSFSLRNWYSYLEEYSRKDSTLEQLDYWKNISGKYKPFPKRNEKKGRYKDMDVKDLSISKELTSHILYDIAKVYNTEINDVLLCALALTLAEWSGLEDIVIGLEGHGREELHKQVDVSSTIGWFTSLYPVLLNLSNLENPGEKIKSVKEQLRSVPDKGMGYGVLKCIAKSNQLKGRDPWDIVFNYLGQLDNVTDKSSWFSPTDEAAGLAVSPENRLMQKMSVNCHVKKGSLKIKWSYDKTCIDGEEILSLLNSYQNNLGYIVEHCLITPGPNFTPSDFGLEKEIKYKELDKFLNRPYKTGPLRNELQSMYRLSALQEGMLFHHLYQSDTGNYIEQFSASLQGLDLKIFEECWNLVLQKHSILRSAFFVNELKVPVQVVLAKVKIPFVEIDYTSLTRQERERSIEAFKIDEKKRGFKIEESPLMRISLLKISKTEHVMIWTSHHMLIDGWSLQIIMDEFLNLYETLSKGLKAPMIKEDQYEDYIRFIEKLPKRESLNFWDSYLKNLEGPTLLPFIRKSNERNKGEGIFKTLNLEINKKVNEKITEFVKRNNLTSNTLIQGVWANLLHTYTRSEAISYGVVVSGRPAELNNVENKVGLFINTLPLFSSKTHNHNIVEWLRGIQEGQVSSREYQYSSLSVIQNKIGIEGDLFDSILVFENYPINKIIGSKKWKLEIKGVEVSEQANYPLTIMVVGTDQLMVKFLYNSSVLDDFYMKNIVVHFEKALEQFLELEFIDDVELIGSGEKEILESFNTNSVKYPEEKTLIDLFEEQALLHPDRIAVSFKDINLSYAELKERSDKLAHYLIRLNVKNEDIIPVCLNRSPEMIISLLGVMKSGAAYLPIDPENPLDRLQFMLKDSKAKWVVCSGKTSKLIASTETTKVNIDLVLKEKNAASDQISVNLKPEQLAYIIYTSGSTGKPKGAMVEHRNVVRLFKNETPLFDFNEKDVWCLFHSFSFDFSVWEIFGALLFGGKLVIVPNNVTINIGAFAKLLVMEEVTVLNQTPSAFYALQDYFKLHDLENSVRYLIFGGESLEIKKLHFWHERYPETKLINMYGITETTVHVTHLEIQKSNIESDVRNIGKPIPTLQVNIFGKKNELLPVGVYGEIYVGGAGVARGYLNRKELTAEKFINIDKKGRTDHKMYRSGDLARWLPDGNLEFLGRADDQVKIRGFRIEPGEIEKIIESHKFVRKCKILSHKVDDGTDDRIDAFIVPNERKFPLFSEFLKLAEKDPELAEKLRILNNGLPVFGDNQNEIDFLYKEIFAERNYDKIDFELNQESIVFDVGANLGFFMIYLNQKYPGITVYAFEPLPEVYRNLNANRKLYDVKGQDFQLALLDEEKEIEFTYYPQLSILSGIEGDKNEVKNTVRDFILSQEEKISAKDAEALVEAKLNSVQLKCDAQTLSNILALEEIPKIDLLKIDVENSEHLVLKGIEGSDWNKINNLIIEVHDIEDRLIKIKENLEKRGFFTHIEKENLLSEGKLLYNIYASRKELIFSEKQTTGKKYEVWINKEKLQNELIELSKEKLPEYMIPGRFFLTSAFPLTLNGKLDKKKLLTSTAYQTQNDDFVSPVTETEIRMSEIWKKLLQTERISIHDNFFMIGGHSITSMRLMTSIEEEFGLTVPVKVIFQFSTIESLSQYIDLNSDTGSGSSEPKGGQVIEI
ncbi:MAG: amino acid adenylation domain-containing protein [Flavobacteriales bacterium]|nr:amino acid adenylation domain-containing protein [Flavobacteriales bacterium]